MEDYKTKYEIAIKKAKEELKCCGSLDCDAARQIFRFFPELKESEDEKIRKDIIKVFTGEIGFTTKEEAKKYIAWLEKQGEQKFVDKCKDCNNVKGCITCTDGDQYAHIKKYNPAWSEEDEYRVKATIYFLDTAKKHYASTVKLDACINWLKSLKERLKGE